MTKTPRRERDRGREHRRGTAATPARPYGGTRRPKPLPELRTPVVVLLIAFSALVVHRFFTQAPFHSDDYIILNRVWNADFLSLWEMRDLPFHYYRPWSREVHYWTLFHIGGAHPFVFRVASMTLWLCAMVLYFTFVRRLTGVSVAALACAGVAVSASWDATLEWAAGAQDFWMLSFAMLFLHAYVRRWTWLAVVALIGAILSKETAVVLPGIAVAYSWAVERAPVRQVLARVLPQAAVIVAWALFNRVLWTRIDPTFLAEMDPNERHPPLIGLIKSVLSLVNLEHVPRPEFGWRRAIAPGLLSALAIGGLAAWGLLQGRSRVPGAAESASLPGGRKGLIVFCAAWTVLGWLAILTPFVAYHDYYRLLGTMGAWAGLALVLARWRPLAIAVVAAMALLQVSAADTVRMSVSSIWYQRYMGALIERLRVDLLAKHATVPPHTRMYFARVPEGTSFGMDWFNRVLEFWYRDTTLRTARLTAYEPRTGPPGRDLIFAFDPDSVRWNELVAGPEDVPAARRANRWWLEEHDLLARLFEDKGDPSAACAEWRKLAAVVPESAFYVSRAASCDSGARSP